MIKEEKQKIIESLAEKLKNSNYFYLTDISDLNSVDTSKLRRLCFKKDIRLQVIKNSLLRKAMEKTDKNFESLYETLKGPTALMFAEAGNIPAKLIIEFRKTSEKPIIKGAYVEEMTYLGDDQLEFLSSIKSKNELIGDIIGLLQSPAKNVISALQSGGGNLAGILKTLSERPE
jgi:large subunit ribosomal protein L10